MVEEYDCRKMVREWAEHAADPFRGKPRVPAIEEALTLAITTAFSIGVVSIPEIKGVKFGYQWSEDGEISVAVDPEDKITDDMLVLVVGE